MIDVFKPGKKTFLADRIDWKRVQLKKVKADSDQIVVAYKVIVDGVTVGAVGKMKNFITHAKKWAWVKANESFKSLTYDRHNYTKEWAIVDILKHATKA